MESSLSFRARLVHAEAGKRVVQLSAWQGSSCLGSALGEAESAELAEERALERLQARLNQPPAQQHQPPNPPPQPEAPVRHPVVRRPPAEDSAEPIQAQAPTAETIQPSLPQAQSQPEAPAVTAEPQEPAADPEDWSDELAEIDIQLKRLGWDRNQEGTYLQRAFGHPSRNRITNYTDLAAYVRSLRDLKPSTDPAAASIPLRRRDLLSQSDDLLTALQWDANRGRQALEQQFKLSSRQQLSDEQLLEFNMQLETTLIGSGSGEPAAPTPG